jgi:hypothetical protein
MQKSMTTTPGGSRCPSKDQCVPDTWLELRTCRWGQVVVGEGLSREALAGGLLQSQEGAFI